MRSTIIRCINTRRLLVYSSPKFQSAADVTALRLIVWEGEVGLSIIGIVASVRNVIPISKVNRKMKTCSQIGALPDDKLQEIGCGQGACRRLSLMD